MTEIIKKEQKPKKPKYKVFKDKKMISIFVLIFFVSMQMFAFLSVPGLTTLHKYTVGMLMGWYHPLFYGFIIFWALAVLFNIKEKLPSWIRIKTSTYIFLSVSILFIIGATGYYQTIESWTSIGAKPWGAVSHWWAVFKHSGDAWLPSATNGGFIAAFMYSFFAMIFSGIGAMVFSIILVVLAVSLLASGSLIGLYKNLSKKKKMDISKEKEKQEKSSELKELEIEKDDDIFPFEDPFEKN